jgi:hypothetical protein
MTDHLKEPRTVDRGMEHPSDGGRTKTEATGFDLGSWSASGGGGSSSPNSERGTRGNNQDLESPSPK